MGGIRITCEMLEHLQCYRILDIPEDISFKNLSDCLQLAFGLEKDSEHIFTVGEKHIPITQQEDQALREMQESDLSIRKIILGGHTVTYHYATRENAFDIKVRKKRLLGTYKKSFPTLVEGIGMPEDGLDLEEEEKAAFTPSKIEGETFEDIQEALENFFPDCMGSSAPDEEEFIQKNLEHIDEHLHSLGLDTKTIFERMDESFEKRTPLPQAPPMPKERGPLYQNMVKAKEWANAHPKARVRVLYGKKTILDYLSDFDPVGLYDYCKYLQLMDRLKDTESEKARAISNAYHAEPELLLYPLEQFQVQEFLAFAQIEQEGSCSCDLFHAYVLMGIAKFSMEEETLYLASDLKEVLSGLSGPKGKATRNTIDSFDSGFEILIKHYGVLEVGEVRQMLRQYFSLSLPQKQCLRLIYWRHSLMSKIITFTFTQTDALYCAQKGLDLNTIMPQLFITEHFIPYAHLNDYEIQQWKHSGDYMDVFAGWSYLFGMYMMNMRMEKDEARRRCDEMYEDVRNGAGLKECMEWMGVKNEANALQMIRVMIWEIALHFVLGTALPSLKGANRVTACRNPAYTMCMAIDFAGETVQEEEIGKHTHLEDMPTDIQLEIGSRLFTLEESDLGPLRKIQRSFATNIDLNYIMGLAYSRLGHTEEALPFFERADRYLEGKDPSMKSVIQLCRKGQYIMPIRVYGDGMVLM